MSEFMMQKYLEINNWIESLKREEGQTLAEYALLLALIAIFMIAILIFFRGQLIAVFQRIGNALTGAGTS